MREVVPTAARKPHRFAQFVLVLGVLCQLGASSENPPGMPCTNRVMKQEEHHVVLREQLGNRWQFIRADLLPRTIDLVLPLGLPELIGPPERVVSGEDADRQRFEM